MTPRSFSGGARVASAFDTLLVLSRSLTGAKQGGVLTDALDLLLAGVGCARGAAYSTVGDALELVGERGLPAGLRPALARLSLTETPWFVAQKAARTRKVVADRDVAESDEGHLDPGVLAMSRWAQAVACPIAAGREVFGVIVLAWPASEEPDYLTLALLEVACAMLALQIARRSDEHRSDGRADDVNAARLQALGVLARGFAEDLDEHLGVLSGRLGAPLQPARDATARFLGAVQPSPPGRVELGALVSDVIALAAPHLRRRNVEVQVRCEGEHVVIGRRRELTQLFLHLVLGAAGVADHDEDADSDRDALVRRVFAVDVVLQSGHEVVSLSDAGDDGTGARASFFGNNGHSDNAFELAVARRIVIAHEGHIEVGPTATSPCSRCSVVLPAATHERASRPASATTGVRAAVGATRPIVLWVDDDDLFLEIMVQSLPDLDIRVARGATEAMQLLTFGVRPALVFCNVRLEGRPGHEVHAEITRQDRTLAERFVFVADGIVTPEIASYLIASGRPTLMRPINVEQVRAFARKDPATLGRAAPTLADAHGHGRRTRTSPEAPWSRSDARQAAPAVKADAEPDESGRPAVPPPPEARRAITAPTLPVSRRPPPPPPSEPALPVAAVRAAPAPAAVDGAAEGANDDEHDTVAEPAQSSRRATLEIDLTSIARAVADTLRREGPRRAALVVAMLLERGLSEQQALSVITFGLSNAIFLRDPPPSTMLRVPGAERRKVLVVDDDFDLRQTLREILQDEGYAVETAANGKAALEVLRRSNPPRVVVLDLMMPVMDGWALLDELRRDDALVDIPVVIISASKSALRAPSTHEFLAKPIDYHKLIATIDRSMKAPRRRSATGLS